MEIDLFSFLLALILLFGLSFVLFVVSKLVSSRNHARAYNELKDGIGHANAKIDELRLQVGILSGRIGEGSKFINISPSDCQTRQTDKKRGWPSGKPRKLTNKNPLREEGGQEY